MVKIGKQQQQTRTAAHNPCRQNKLLASERHSSLDEGGGQQTNVQRSHQDVVLPIRQQNRFSPDKDQELKDGSHEERVQHRTAKVETVCVADAVGLGRQEFGHGGWDLGTAGEPAWV